MLPKKKSSLIPTSGDLRVKDPKVLHAEIAILRQKIASRIAAEPAKAAFLVTELVNQKIVSPELTSRTGGPVVKKKAA